MTSFSGNINDWPISLGAPELKWHRRKARFATSARNTKYDNIWEGIVDIPQRSGRLVVTLNKF
jgi:hypothetical protein